MPAPPNAVTSSPDRHSPFSPRATLSTTGRPSRSPKAIIDVSVFAILPTDTRHLRTYSSRRSDTALGVTGPSYAVAGRQHFNGNSASCRRLVIKEREVAKESHVGRAKKGDPEHRGRSLGAKYLVERR